MVFVGGSGFTLAAAVRMSSASMRSRGRPDAIFEAIRSLPCCIEINTRDMRQNIDTPSLRSETEETTPIREVLWANASQRHAKLGERRMGRVCVSRVGLYEEVDVFGEAGLGMEDDRETADYQVLNAMGMEGGQKVFVILVHPAASPNP